MIHGLIKEVMGSSSGRTGSKRPQLAASCCLVAAFSFSGRVEGSPSASPFLPFRLTLRPPAPGLAAGLVLTAALRAAVMSLTY